jgi:hypothetical protein
MSSHSTLVHSSPLLEELRYLMKLSQSTFMCLSKELLLDMCRLISILLPALIGLRVTHLEEWCCCTSKGTGCVVPSLQFLTSTLAKGATTSVTSGENLATEYSKLIHSFAWTSLQCSKLLISHIELHYRSIAFCGLTAVLSEAVSRL